MDLELLVTESRNSASQNIDTLSTLEVVRVINQEDKKVAQAVEKTLSEVAAMVDCIVSAFSAGGRLVYIGAGTSGRLGILDASECPPTFGTPAEQVIGLIAGGQPAILNAVENAEDDHDLGVTDLKSIDFNVKDVLVGIAASGRTPYVIGAMQYARSVGATVGCISCNPNSEMAQCADISMVPVVGAEVVTGSSRLKAGTAQKLTLNMLTTASMIRSGKVYGNLMVDVEATNAKLIERQKRIVMQATDCSLDSAELALSACNHHCKSAILMVLTGCSASKAVSQLAANKGFIRHTLA
ncbi:N-acetylmuramic acid 6-phosphate etherase [Vibrio sp. DW001]|uniref:N-acetylmuramic acid 6-phosphate etherase n=1 Tax=Vibrio sp. DW001 TaxID=2912315 RepID=UPI0023B059D2|nr:N-acetylmuramic acid 6-phosphate etherase [Vibrio sp. DW001]WED27831.1 N-acetylmuramic acid 6-phosphate etherase [Vibrio sp. DW001]